MTLVSEEENYQKKLEDEVESFLEIEEEEFDIISLVSDNKDEEDIISFLSLEETEQDIIDLISEEDVIEEIE